jgi:hypothetical protein
MVREDVVYCTHSPCEPSRGQIARDDAVWVDDQPEQNVRQVNEPKVFVKEHRDVVFSQLHSVLQFDVGEHREQPQVELVFVLWAMRILWGVRRSMPSSPSHRGAFAGQASKVSSNHFEPFWWCPAGMAVIPVIHHADSTTTHDAVEKSS